MREKAENRGESEKLPEADFEQLRRDLEERGIDPEYSRPISQQLVAVAPERSTREYDAVLAGVVATYRAQREVSESHAAADRRAHEMQRLIEGFARELRKFDEGLQLLSAFLVRMSRVSIRDSSDKIH